MKIYTKGGDKGETSLLGGQRVSKLDQRVVAGGEIDELNASLGIALAYAPPADVAGGLRRIQSELFELGAWTAGLGTKRAGPPNLSDETVDRLETEMDTMQRQLQPLQHFILPGGAHSAAFLHLSRTISRRVERCILDLASAEAGADNPTVLAYLNRLSDWLFVSARRCNQHATCDETKWNG